MTNVHLRNYLFLPHKPPCNKTITWSIYLRDDDIYQCTCKARQVEIEKWWAMNARSNWKETSDERRLETSGKRCAGSNRGDEQWTLSQTKRQPITPFNQKTSHNAIDTVITLHNIQQSTNSRGSKPQRLHLIVPYQTQKMCSAIDPNWEISYTLNKGI